MSTRAVTQFFQKVVAEETLQGAIVSLAAKNGYDFTSDELLRRMGADEMELSDTELDHVAGGVAKKKPAKKKKTLISDR